MFNLGVPNHRSLIFFVMSVFVMLVSGCIAAWEVHLQVDDTRAFLTEGVTVSEVGLDRGTRLYLGQYGGKTSPCGLAVNAVYRPSHDASDPWTGGLEITGDLVVPRRNFQLQAIPGGMAILTGGEKFVLPLPGDTTPFKCSFPQPVTEKEVFDPVTMKWSLWPGSPLPGINTIQDENPPPVTNPFTHTVLSSTGSYATRITAGPDGNVWFTEVGGAKVGKITPSGTVTEYALPAGVSPQAIAAGPDGNIWTGDGGGGKILRISPAGVVTSLSLPSYGSYGVTAGPDNNVWYTTSYSNTIGRLTPAGAVSEFPLPSGMLHPSEITTGPDGNLWFIAGTQVGFGFDDNNQIGRITPDGVITSVITITSPYKASGIARGADGNIWISEYGTGGSKVGRITPSGTLTEFTVPNGYGATGITPGPDGAIWFSFTVLNAGYVGWVDPSGLILEFYASRDGIGKPYYLAAGPDGNIWFTEISGNAIGNVSPSMAQADLARVGHSSTLVNGQVMIAGGIARGNGSNNTPTYVAELYNAESGARTRLQMASARAYHTATLLPDGKVLLAGGLGPQTTLLDSDRTFLSSAELFDPASSTFTATGSLVTARWDHEATLLPDGRVLVTGGFGASSNGAASTALASAEVYNPTTGTWAALPGMATARGQHSATLLYDAMNLPTPKVLVAGGCTDSGCLTVLAGTEIYDVNTNSWTAGGSLTTARARHVADLEWDSTVLIVGGTPGGETGHRTGMASPEVLGLPAQYSPTATAVAALTPTPTPLVVVATVQPTPGVTTTIAIPGALGGNVIVPNDAGGSTPLQVSVRPVPVPTAVPTGLTALRAVQISLSSLSDNSQIRRLSQDVAIEIPYAGLGLTNDQISHLVIYNVSENEYLPTSIDASRQVAIARTRNFSTFALSRITGTVPVVYLPTATKSFPGAW